MASSEIAITDRPEEVTEAPPSVPRESLRRKVLRAASWTMIENLLSRIIRLAGNIILSKLLFPEAFGIAALIGVYQEALSMFTDFGTGDLVVQHPDGDKPKFLNTIWTIQVIRGISLTTIAVAVAWPTATWWMKKPDLAPMLATASLLLTIHGFMSIKQSVALREMRLGTLARRNLIAQVAGLTSLVLMAFWLRSAWAMVFGMILTTTFQVVSSYALLPGPPSRFGLDRDSLRSLAHFGRWTFASTIMTFFANRGDNFLMGRYLTEGMFGIYNISTNLAAVLPGTLMTLAARVAFPLWSRIAQLERHRLPSIYDRTCKVLYLASLPAVGMFAGLSPTVIHIIYDSRYWEAGWLIRLLAGRAALDCLCAPGKGVLLSLGQPRYSAIAEATRAAILLTTLPPAFWYFNVTGAACVAAGNGALALIVIQWGLYNNHLFSLKREMMGIALLLAGIAVGFGLNYVLEPLVS